MRHLGVEVVCNCGRETGGHRVELFDAIGERDWEGERCGPLVTALLVAGQAHPSGSPNDPAAHTSRVFPSRDELCRPKWRGRCRHCKRRAVEVDGDRLAMVLDHWPGERIELEQLRRLARVHPRRGV